MLFLVLRSMVKRIPDLRVCDRNLQELLLEDCLHQRIQYPKILRQCRQLEERVVSALVAFFLYSWNRAGYTNRIEERFVLALVAFFL